MHKNSYISICVCLPCLLVCVNLYNRREIIVDQKAALIRNTSFPYMVMDNSLIKLVI